MTPGLETGGQFIIWMTLMVIGAVLIFLIYLLIRNKATHSILMDALEEWGKLIGNTTKFRQVEKVIKRYSYEDILWSIRPISSFQKEIMDDIRKIRNSKRR